MALSTARIHRVRGRPPLLAAGIISLIHSHSSSVRSLGYIFSFIYPFYTTHEDFSDRLSTPGAARQGDGAGRYALALDASDRESSRRTWPSQRQRSQRPLGFWGPAAAIASRGSSWYVAVS